MSKINFGLLTIFKFGQQTEIKLSISNFKYKICFSLLTDFDKKTKRAL